MSNWWKLCSILQSEWHFALFKKARYNEIEGAASLENTHRKKKKKKKKNLMK
jgi:hypothetical protein